MSIVTVEDFRHLTAAEFAYHVDGEDVYLEQAEMDTPVFTISAASTNEGTAVWIEMTDEFPEVDTPEELKQQLLTRWDAGSPEGLDAEWSYAATDDDPLMQVTFMVTVPGDTPMPSLYDPEHGTGELFSAEASIYNCWNHRGRVRG